MSNPAFKFLQEKPLEAAGGSQSKFGHEEIANTLVEIVKNCPAPFTVGLFAKWGSGKSTVANSLASKLPRENIPVVLFDVWKHEGDALRRTFLKETVRQLKDAGKNFFDQDFMLDEKLEQSVSRSSESRFVFQKEKLMQLAWPIIIGLAAVAITGWAADYFGYLDFYQYFITALFGTATAGGLLLWLAKQSLQLFSTETINYGNDKFSDPHQFEQEFGRVLGALKNPRVLIIFDNLDRVMHDKVAEVLSTVKTFLEPQDIADKEREVVFLVPCDAKAIKQHLSSVYNPADKTGENNHAFDPDEFLRKFFNTIVWIPDFIPSELEAFARAQLRETKVALFDNDYVAWIITKAFRNNPRQVIQFTNILLANYLLVEQRQGADKDFPDGFLKDNIPQLTKYLVLNQLFPDDMDKLREKKVLDLDEAVEPSSELKLSQEFLDFVTQTKNIPIPDLRTYFTLRRSEQEKKFPGFESFIALLEDRSVDDASKYFDQLGDFSQPDLVADFSQAIKEELESKVNPVSTVNLIHTLLAVLKTRSIALAGTLYEEINNVLTTRCKEELHTISPEILNDAFLVKKANYRPSVISQWLTVLEDVGSNTNKYKSDRNFSRSVLSILASQPDYLTNGQPQKAREILSNYYASDIDIAKAIVQSSSSQTALVNADYLRNMVNAIPTSGNADDISARLAVLNDFEDGLLRSAGPEQIVKKFSEIQTAQNQNTKPESFAEKIKILTQFRAFISKHKAIVPTATAATRDLFVDSLNAGFNAPSDHELRSAFVPILFEMRQYATDPKKAEIDQFISSWAGNIRPDAFGTSLDSLSQADQQAFFAGTIYENTANRALSDNDFRKVFFSRLTDDKKADFLKRLISSDINRAFDYFESLDPKDAKHVFSIIGTLWDRFDSLNASQRQRLFKFVNDHKGDSDAAVRDVLATKISNCLHTMDVGLQQIGLEALNGASTHISKELKRRIVKETFDWIRKPEVSPKYQTHAIRGIVFNSDQFNAEEQKELIHFLFDETIRKSQNQGHINGAFELLKELKPKYEERQQNFDDVKARIEQEGNLDLKKVLIEGLNSLRPSKTNKETNQEFWDWVQTQVDGLNPSTP